MREREERRGRERKRKERREQRRGRERTEVCIELCNNTKHDNMSLTLRSVVRYARQDCRSPTSL